MNEPHSDSSPWIVETNDSSFEKDVLDRSREVPVVVDFWAPWCQPCRMLTPILEKLVGEFEGKFILVKVNTDEAQMTAAQFRIQSIPCVYGFRDGQIVDSFVGVLPEDQLRAWLERLVPSEAELLTREGRALEQDDPSAAEAVYRRAIEAAPDESGAKIALASLLLSQDRADESRRIVEQLESRGFLETEAEAVKAALELNRLGEESPDIAACRAELDAQPDSGELQLKLAGALAAAQQYEEALQLSLDLVRRDKQGIGQPAKQLMLDIFRVLPDDSELISEYRRQLSAALY
jgi:putative thioredoxin